jgi:biotin carboxylase
MVIVDCYSTGAHVAKYAAERGFKVVGAWSTQEQSLLDLVPKDVDVKFEAVIQLTTIEAMLAELKALPWKIEAIIAGAETGVELTDALSERMNLRTNCESGSLARRDKYIMGEAVRSAGLRAVEQAICSDIGAVNDFLTQHARYPVVLKPVDSGGTDGVTLCATLEEALAAFAALHGKVNLLGSINEAVLVQEFLAGTEYVVDTLSRDGEHKVSAIWEYDRRNGPSDSGFVCYGQKLIACDTPLAKQLIAYMLGVLDALNIANGPAHSEVKIFNGEAVLVETGARCHGAEGFWCTIADECLGRNQASSTIDCYTHDSSVFDSLPFHPVVLKSGRMKWLISYVAGTLKGVESTDRIQELQSYRAMDLWVETGKEVHITKNCFTWGGCVKMCHEQEEQMDKDYVLMEEIEQNMFQV